MTSFEIRRCALAIGFRRVERPDPFNREQGGDGSVTSFLDLVSLTLTFSETSTLGVILTQNFLSGMFTHQSSGTAITTSFISADDCVSIDMKTPNRSKLSLMARNGETDRVVIAQSVNVSPSTPRPLLSFALVD